MKSKEFLPEGDVTKGDFGAKGGPKPQMQHAKQISMAQAFGSEGYNVLAGAGIKLQEKPSYWSDLERTPIGEIGLAKVRKLFKQAGVQLPEVEAWEVFPIDPSRRSAHVKNPLASIENMPTKGVFVISDLPYYDEQTEEVKQGDFLVDSHGASSYIRFWRKI